MKKLLTITMVAVFILALAAVTYAAELKASGYVRQSTGWYRNAEVDDFQALDTLDDSNAWADYRARVKFDLVASENLSGTVYFEMDDYWGGTADGALGADSKGVEIKNAYIKFKVPGLEGFPTTATVGIHGPFISNLGIDGDASGVMLDTKVEPVDLRLSYIKGIEGDFNAADDFDYYSARATMPVGDLRAGLWFTWAHAGGGSLPTRLAAGTPSSSNLYWIGGLLDGKVGPASFSGEFAYNGGKVDYSSPVAGATDPAVDEDKFGGYAFIGNVSMPVSQFEVGAQFQYTSGDDRNDTLNGKFDGYRLPHDAIAAAYHPTIVYYSSGFNDRVGMTSALADTIDAAGVGEALSGDWLIKGYASFKPLDWLKVTGYAAYIGDNVDKGDRFGTATKSDGTREDNGDVGIEIGAYGDLQVYKELVWTVGAGWLLAGDALDQGTATPGVNKSPDDPWAVVSQLMYKF